MAGEAVIPHRPPFAPLCLHATHETLGQRDTASRYSTLQEEGRARRCTLGRQTFTSQALKHVEVVLLELSKIPVRLVCMLSCFLD